MKLANNSYSFKNNLIEAAIRKETSDEATREALAGKHAIKMLEEIDDIMENQGKTIEEKYDKIMQVVRFAHVRPHI